MVFHADGKQLIKIVGDKLDKVITDKTPNSRRISYLDGLRGISIIGVLIQHAFGPWAVMFHNSSFHSPFSENVQFFPPILYAYLAVQLFFFISGYVILITLEKCSGFREFIWRRWIRLFPAMLICSLLIYWTATIFQERPMGQPHLSSLLPGLTFVEPHWWATLLGRPQSIIEGSFWSLYVEVRFYFIFGIIYFIFGARMAIIFLIGFYCVGLYIRFMHSVPFMDQNTAWHFFSSRMDIVYVKFMWWGLNDSIYYGSFACGAVFSRYMSSRKAWLLILATVLGLSSGLMLGANNPSVGHVFGGMAVGVVFMCVIPMSCAIPFMQRIYGSRFLVFMGFVSYPLYLLHQNMMVASIIKLQNHFPHMPPILATFLPIFFVIILAILVAKYVEPFVKSIICVIANLIYRQKSVAA